MTPITSVHPPSKRLEITVISAHDLPPVSKVLHTYAVAWLESDHKLTTRIDQKGHTNPRWNNKLVFPLQENFSKSDTNTILTIEIYNAVSLRDIPIGTAQVLVSNLLAKNIKNERPFALRMSRPTGLLQGVVHVGVTQIDSLYDNVTPLGSEILINDEKSVSSKEGKIRLERSRTERTAKDEDFLGGGDGTVLTRSKSGDFSTSTPVESVCSMMRTLPSEVLLAFKKGIYSTGGDDYGSSIFENWTETGDRVDDGGLSDTQRKKRRRGGGGWFSCFGTVFGMEMSFVCGSNLAARKKNKNKNEFKNKKNKVYNRVNVRQRRL